MNTEKVIKRDQKYIMHTYARSPLVLEHGEGMYAYDADGKAYLDFTSGIGVNALGYCHPAWVQAVTMQATRLQHSSNLYYTAPCGKLAKRLCARTGLDQVFFGNSGAEANEGAIKCARKYSVTTYGPDRNKVLTLVNSFHGRTLATLTATGQEVFHNYFGPFPANFGYIPANDFDTFKAAVDDSVCAVMMEMVQGEGGVLDLDPDFVKAAEQLCHEHDLVFIVDEVQTGIGRTGKLFAYEYFDVTPDIVTFAKGIGGGLPIGGVLFGEKCCDVLKPGDHGTTYGGNPVACAGAVEVLTRIDDAFLKEVQKKSAYLKDKLQTLPHVTSVSGLGLMLGVSLEGKEAPDVVKKALEEGLMVLTAKDKVRLLPPLTITYDEIDQGVEILKKALS